MELLSKDISTFPIISFIISIFIIYGILRLIERVVPFLIKRYKTKVAFKRKYSFFELLIWLIYLIYVLPYFFQRNFAFGVVISIVVVIDILLISWYIGRDIVAGFIIKTNIGFKEGAIVEIDGMKGRISNLYSRNFKLINDKGEKMILPYSQYVSKTITFFPDAKDKITSMMRLELKSDKTINNIKEELKYFIMTHPKALINVIPDISIVNYEDGVYTLEINLAARDNSSFTEIKSDINKKFKV